MKKRTLATLLIASLMVTSVALFVLKHNSLVKATIPQSATSSSKTQVMEIEDNDSQVQEPNYVGSIKVIDTNSNDETSEEATLKGLAKISKADAEAFALTKVPGTVVKTSLENENGYLVYSVEIKNAQGKVSDVKIDAGSGTVLNIESSNEFEESGTIEKGEENSKTPDVDTVHKEFQIEN